MRPRAQRPRGPARPKVATGDGQMKKQDVEVGGTYVAKVGARSVEVKVEGENPKGGWNATAVGTGKPVRVKDAKNLRPGKLGGEDGTAGDADAQDVVEESADADHAPAT